MQDTEKIIEKDLERIMKSRSNSGDLFTIEQLTKLINEDEPRYGMSKGGGAFRPGELKMPLKRLVDDGKVEEENGYRWKKSST